MITRHRFEAGGVDESGEAIAEAIEAKLRTGRSLAAEEWIARHEAVAGRPLRPAKPWPKPKEGVSCGG